MITAMDIAPFAGTIGGGFFLGLGEGVTEWIRMDYKRNRAYFEHNWHFTLYISCWYSSRIQRIRWYDSRVGAWLGVSEDTIWLLEALFGHSFSDVDFNLIISFRFGMYLLQLNSQQVQMYQRIACDSCTWCCGKTTYAIQCHKGTPTTIEEGNTLATATGADWVGLLLSMIIQRFDCLNICQFTSP